jgi:hypothetical protein
MDYYKRTESELLLAWHKIQREKVPALREAALKAYYQKLRVFQKQKAQNLF